MKAEPFTAERVALENSCLQQAFEQRMDGLSANSLKKVKNAEWPQGKTQPRRLGGGGDKEIQMEGRGK